ncbi:MULTISPECIES: nicotinate-nucleotide--dimethylbenzimidazole phosphoribosyltransferase [Segatella]|jgi:nicotinate-nucleotide--dimethylbenzimidazole phosphoribosyltransferase|uniref:Nicotinate-nucleotide--dimethylbenzimidazole phosphoribosyltransferase n=2 Tax=Segatella TaxID=2974251 RepID=D8DZD9_9BACT|nr:MULTISPECIES: nicotinate-nucleotide--dimethylbenzimidazole phosphoribosyltransferase [Segatella]MBQ3857509.1 nicotinate-nucleotide--dimethylbenzimidazole phosphoribosyltransferase [Prevotella sp.]EFI71209.1 nicotinate-nucleotide--dimethylbenzimidazole phosphoribosyltransferase [Segatella baroniae B14]MDR4929895.1 nicotinate-nucleotide--dimethylbenzimidazole phosphoribosyltransferase [Segatella bryantii]MEE3414437.1 nicotinate-nucleotide--dimethylbenzimidazole phosphoribosyltransferase [Prevo
MQHFHILEPDQTIRQEALEKIDNLNKPKGSLGILENIALKLCLIQQTLSPSLHYPCHLLLGADHGIEREGVSASPREVTWQQMINFTRGGGFVDVMCRQHNFELKIVDMGVDYDLSDFHTIINYKIAHGTANFLQQEAMTLQQWNECIERGCQLVDQCIAKGSTIISIGEMGIGNTSPSSIWMSLFGNMPLDICIGAGSGLNSAGIQHKLKVLTKSVQKFLTKFPDIAETLSNTPQGKCPNYTFKQTEQILYYFSGFEMAAAIGAMLRAAERHVTILIDGFIMTACILGASKLYPNVLHYAIFGHCGDESGHQKMLNLLHAQPLLQLGLRLGEGTGALCAFPIVDSACRMINEMNNFENAKITKYF